MMLKIQSNRAFHNQITANPASGRPRRAVAALLLCALCCCAIPLRASAAPSPAAVTANGHVYLRKGPGTTYDTVLVLKPDAEMKVTGSSGNWYKVTYGKKTGYVNKDVVTPKGTAKKDDPATPSASGASNTAIAYRTLKQGMTGEDVTRLQEGLIYAGFFDLMPNGKYDKNTKTAVTNYQNASKLKADGIAGEETQRKLLGDPGSAAASGAEADSAQVAYAEPSPGSALRLGSKGDAVRQLQTQLQTLGYLKPKPDGSYGLVTQQAVMSFQSANKLKADGVAGSATLKALSDALNQKSETIPAPAAGNASSVLKEGSKNDAVKQLQAALRDLGYYGGTVSGNFGQLTTEAVKAFQKANKLTADGVAGSATLTKLYGGSAVAHDAKNSSGGSAAKENGPNASGVQHTGMSTIRQRYKVGTVVTVYDFRTKLTWKCRFYSMGVHADSEPLTGTDTDIMYRAFGNRNTWTPKAVWITTPDGHTYIASMHNVPHLSGSIKNNNFPGHLCIHFPRTMADAEKTGSYAVSHQEEIAKGWEETQKMAGR